MAEPVYLDPFEGKLVTPNPLAVSDEQKDYIKAILDKSSSDSRFALKAYIAIMKILLGESVVPVILSIDPEEGASGTPEAVEVTITGENFEAASVVLQAGAQIPSAFVNETTLTASVALSGAQPGVLAISVRNSTMLTSNVVNFTVTAPLPLTQVANEQSGFTAVPTTLTSPTAVVASTESTDAPVVTEEPVVNPDFEKVKAQIAAFQASRTPTDQFTPPSDPPVVPTEGE